MVDANQRWPEKQDDGSYRIPEMNQGTVVAVWGTVHYWVHRHALLDRAPEFKRAMSDQFSTAIFVEEGGCSFRLFPDYVADSVASKLKARVGRGSSVAN